MDTSIHSSDDVLMYRITSASVNLIKTHMAHLQCDCAIKIGCAMDLLCKTFVAQALQNRTIHCAWGHGRHEHFVPLTGKRVWGPKFCLLTTVADFVPLLPKSWRRPVDPAFK